MADVYYNTSDPGSFGGIKRLEERYNKKGKDIRKWLTFQDTYTLHKPVRKSFPRRGVQVYVIYYQWQINLMDLSSLSRLNDDYNFISHVYRRSLKVRMGGAYDGQIFKIIGRRSSTPIHHFKDIAK